MLMTYLQQLATRKISKNRQNSKANSFFLSRNIDLAAKTPQKRPVFSVSTNLALGVLIAKTLWHSKLRLFFEMDFLSKNRSLVARSRRRKEAVPAPHRWLLTSTLPLSWNRS
jgi:hypothetical protein